MALLDVLRAIASEDAGEGGARATSEHSADDKRQAAASDSSLAARFLTPRPVLPDAWLRELVYPPEIEVDYGLLYDPGETISRSRFRFIREGLEGRIVGYEAYTAHEPELTARNSTSLQRKASTRNEFVRGSTSAYPLAPGGLEAAVDRLAQTVDLSVSEDEPIPGLPRKMRLSGDAAAEQDIVFSDKISTDDKPGERKAIAEIERENVGQLVHTGTTLDSLDDLLPDDFPDFLKHEPLPAARGSRKSKQWAHVVDVHKDFTNFRELVPNLAHSYPFELDTFQKEAVYHLENGHSVFVAAHTSAGKTVVAEYAIALAAKHLTRAIYTSPIKALSNQKFRDFSKIFGEVGILTGDVQIQPEASCLIMTTEILRSMLYRGADLIRDVEFVIFDEVHYINDTERGVVWEEVIIMLPDHVNIILLSATVPNTKEFASWVGRTKQRDIFVISTPKRPVPLEHYLWAAKSLYKIVDADREFITKGWKDAYDALHPVKAPTEAAKESGKFGPNLKRHFGGRGGNATRGRSSLRTIDRQDKNMWIHLVHYLRKESYLPAVIFVFSKRRCEESAASLSNVDLNNAKEKSEVHVVIERSLSRLKAVDRILPQILRTRELLSRGLAVHHGGLLPIVKEMVEILFARGLVKVLFATETFAMGVNMPARTVVFSGTRKHDGRNFRDLLPGEYTQMAGRAGRRGLDTTGTVIIATAPDEIPDTASLHNMILGNPAKLQSQFRLTYTMILNLLRIESLKVEDMIRRSFSENATQALVPHHNSRIEAAQDALQSFKPISCEICDQDISECYAICEDIATTSVAMMERLIASSGGRRIVSPGRLVLVKRHHKPRLPAVVLSTTFEDTIQVVMPICGEFSVDDLPALPFLVCHKIPGLLQSFKKKLLFEKVSTETIFLTDLEFISNQVYKSDLSFVQKRDKQALLDVTAYFKTICENIPGIQFANLEKIKDLQFIEMKLSLDNLLLKFNTIKSIQCPEFISHYNNFNSEMDLRRNIERLKLLLSDKNLELLPDYEQRLKVLQELGFIDEHANVLLKGRVACEISSVNELILTEFVLENTLADYTPEEIVALLSAFVFEEKTDVEPVISHKLQQGKEMIIDIARRVNTVQERHQVLYMNENNEFENMAKFGLVEVVYEWARGMSFNRITDLTDVLEGTIVRVITRLDETCREVKTASRLIGDMDLYKKMETAQGAIRKDIIFAASLYF